MNAKYERFDWRPLRAPTDSRERLLDRVDRRREQAGVLGLGGGELLLLARPEGQPQVLGRLTGLR